MKYYRKWWLFSRQRRRQQTFLLTLGFLTISLFGFFLLYQILISNGIETINSIPFASSLSRCHCSKSSLVYFKNGECFFNQIVCYPGFGGDQCEINLDNEAYRSHCPSDTHRTKWNGTLIKQTRNKCLKLKVAQQEWNTSCLFLCFYHRLTGIIQIPHIFWFTSLNNELNYWKENPMATGDRLYEHVEGFHGYSVLPLEIQSIVEIGAGPFTQLQYLLTPFRSIKKITLIDPNALDYMKMNNCAYRGGHLRGYPVRIVAESIEQLMQKRRRKKFVSNSSMHYSAVMSINVVEHVSDALEYFRGLYDLLEDNGLLIFHERWYDYPQQGDCVLDSAENLHPIRITRWVMERFLDQFETLYVNFNRTRRQINSPCFEQGIYFIGRKKSHCV